MPLSCLCIGLFYICSAQNVIYTDLVKIRQSTEDMRRNHTLSAFIVGIGSLRYIDCIANLGLCQVGIFPKVADSWVMFHSTHQKQYSLE